MNNVKGRIFDWRNATGAPKGARHGDRTSRSPIDSQSARAKLF
jgi:hypothetical protein